VFLLFVCDLSSILIMDTCGSGSQVDFVAPLNQCNPTGALTSTGSDIY